MPIKFAAHPQYAKLCCLLRFRGAAACALTFCKPVATNVMPSALLAGLFPTSVVAFEARGAVAPETLHPQEAEYVTRATPKRVREFAAGRACARAALAQLQIEGFPLHVGPDREPQWPGGVSGSITHTADYCGVVVARNTHLTALGVDAETRAAVRPALWRQICTAEEQAWLRQIGEAQALEMATLIFSAKEAFFKCQFPATRQWLNFSDVSVSVEANAFWVHPRARLRLESLLPAPWRGRFALQDELVVTGICIAADTTRAGGGASAPIL